MNAFQIVAIFTEGKHIFDELQHDGVLDQTFKSVEIIKAALADKAFATAIKAIESFAKNPQAALIAGEEAIKELAKHAEVVSAVMAEYALLEAEYQKEDVKAFFKKVDGMLPQRVVVKPAH